MTDTFTPGYEAGNPTAPMKTWTRPNGVVTRFDWYGAGDGDNALGLKEIRHTKPIGGDNERTSQPMALAVPTHLEFEVPAAS
ncbi:MAG: hypothetical protein V4733_03255 [Verrucomicrobiota bacterium]